MQTAALKDAKYGPIVAIVNSASQPDTRYEVRRNPQGLLTCGCMGWRFSKEKPRMCRHARATAAEVGVTGVATQPLGQAAPARTMPVPQPQRSIREEARAVAEVIVSRALTPQYRNAVEGLKSFATDKIEAAIRQFLKSTVDAVSTTVVPVPVASGVRYICLDE